MYLVDSILIEKLLQIIKKIIERTSMNKIVVNPEYSLELRDCLLWCINNIGETITQPTGKKYKFIQFFFLPKFRKCQ
jgi:hypothetical protein